MQVFILSVEIRKTHSFYMQAKCLPPLPVPEFSKIIKHKKHGKKRKKKVFYGSKLTNKILRVSPVQPRTLN